MNIYSQINALVCDNVRAQFPDVDLGKIDSVPPKEAGHGDIATNAAMIVAAQTGKKPREIAEIIADKLRASSAIAKVEIAGAGFINMTLRPEIWQAQLATILEYGRGYGNSEIGVGKRVNIEFVSANPTGPLHVGHARGAVVGDALAMLLVKSGYSVTKEYYINDAGAQIDKLAESAYLRYQEACGAEIAEIPEGLYPGDYLVPVGEALRQIHGRSLLEKSKEEWLPVVRIFAVDAMLELIKDDLSRLGIIHDVFSSERKLAEEGKVDEALNLLAEMNLLYEGVLEAPKGKVVDDWEARPQTLFKATEFGDDSDRAVKKSDGSWTYFAPDIAYHYDKCKRGFSLLINIFGADHGGYVKRIKAAVKALSAGEVAIEVRLCQLVKFLRSGEPLKMSKRAGTFVTVREVVDEVGAGVFRFIMLTRKNDAPLDFDFAKVMEQSKDNPVFYVQYAHARCRSVLRNAAADFSASYQLSAKPDKKLLANLSHPAELALIRLLASWPRVVEAAAAALEPHRVAFYLHDVASEFHSLWNLGNDDLSVRFLQKDDVEKTAARMALAKAVSEVIASGLMVMGIEPLEEMR